MVGKLDVFLDTCFSSWNHVMSEYSSHSLLQWDKCMLQSLTNINITMWKMLTCVTNY